MRSRAAFLGFGLLWSCASPSPEPLAPELELALDLHLTEPSISEYTRRNAHLMLPAPGEGPPGVLEIFRRAPRATIDYLVARLESPRMVRCFSTEGMEACGWLEEITDLPFPRVGNHEAENALAVETWRRWWSEHRDRPPRDWFCGLEWDEVLRIKRLVGSDPAGWGVEDHALVWAKGRRSFPYLLRFFGQGRAAYLEGGAWHGRWENACLLLSEITGQEVRPRDRDEARRFWLEWARSHRWPLE